MLCTLVAKYLCIYLFLTVRKKSTQQKGRQQNNIPQKVTTTSTPMKKAPVVHKPASHQYPVTCSGKLLDVAFNRECTQLTQKPQSDSDVEVLQEVVAKKTSINGRSGKRPRPSWMPELFQQAWEWSSLGILSQMLCCYPQNLSSFKRMCLQVQTYAVNFFFFVLKSEACLQTAGSSKVRLKVIILQSSQKWGLVFLF